MQPAGRIAPQPWMIAPETRRVVAALTADGAEVRFVGGCVRDTLDGRPVADVDIATDDRPDAVCDLLRRAGIKAVPTGIAHGTITAVCDHRSFEVTTLRRDVETFGRHARVEFTDDWEADAARRDFTFNAMSCRPDGMLFDPFGGTADLGAGRVRFVGNPDERLREDVLRLLRFFRFYAHYGRPPPDAASLAACTAAAPELRRLSGERVRAELLRLLVAPDPAPVMRLMASAGVLPHLLPEAVRFDRLAALVATESGLDLPADPIRRLAAVLRVDANGAATLAARLRLSNHEAARLDGMVRWPPVAMFGAEPRAICRALFDIGRERYRDLALLAASDRPEEAGPLTLRLATAESWMAPRLPIGGADVLATGVPHGPAVGRVLAAVTAWWREQDFAPDRDACLARLAAVGPALVHPTGRRR